MKLKYCGIRRKGDTSTNGVIFFSPSHFGTHIDFPQNTFIIEGKSINDYEAEDFIFNEITIIDISHLSPKDYLIKINDLEFLEE
ncbi:MAG: hypothetical protein U5Q03_13595 [Bacteroidota bacterium]|nr:hypothetical protein [Bacteroidota bacterium]